MNLPDAKWLDFLKAGIPTFLGLAAFAAATLYLNRIGQLPMEMPAVAALIIAVVGLLSGSLAAGLLLGAGYRAVVWFVKPLYRNHLLKKRDAKQKREFISYIPNLSDRERLIFEHLLHHNQRTFENTPDCGHASLLYSLGYVRMLASNREVDYFAVPFGITDPVWEALQERKAEFPYRHANKPRGRTSDISPWRVPRV
ncbi:hypothetical protein ABZT49_03140 [Methylobacterium sp. EM32]|uniref:hypothetical protein n=1 Tax=Methylobacterium sp. EM32 TaxID=3163481 RepID=UPI0033B12895